MQQITKNQVLALLQGYEPPCISLYQPTHRHYPGNQQDPISYRNLLRELEASLARKYPSRAFRPLVEKFESLIRDDDFWQHRTDGLAILATRDQFRIFEFQRPIEELLVVADSFHLKPLLSNVQSIDRYQILCLNRHTARLYEGNRDALDPVELTDVPSTITEALGRELTEPHQTVASYGGGHESHHGHGGKKDEVSIDRDRFFRVIDRGILEHHSRPSGLPLMLAALAEYQTPFREISHNTLLMADGLMKNPDAMTLDELRQEAWKLVEPRYKARLADMVAEYETAKSRRLASDDLSLVAEAATRGRISSVLIEENRQVPGRIDAQSGAIRFGDLADPDTDDLLDDIAELTLRAQGEVVVVPTRQMPTTTGVAATYRY
ncbi:MAG: hypothetical protein ABI718_11660 [Acidobacteriota bacterium]